MVLGDRVCDRLEKHRLTGSRRSDDQCTLSFTDRRDEIDDTGGDIVRPDLHLELLVRIERSQVVEENFLARLLGSLEVDRLDLDESEVSLAFFRRTNLTGNGVSRAKVEFTDLRRTNVDVVRSRKVVVFRGAEEPESVG